MTTAAEQYRALVNRLESIQEAPVDPRSPEERDSQMAAVKGAYSDWEDAEKAKTEPAKTAGPAKPLSPVSGDVKKIQTLLNQKGANLTVDGRLGANTLAAIVKHLEAEVAKPAQAAQPSAQPAAQPSAQPAAAGQQTMTVPGAFGGSMQIPTNVTIPGLK